MYWLKKRVCMCNISQTSGIFYNIFITATITRLLIYLPIFTFQHRCLITNKCVGKNTCEIILQCKGFFFPSKFKKLCTCKGNAIVRFAKIKTPWLWQSILVDTYNNIYRLYYLFSFLFLFCWCCIRIWRCTGTSTPTRTPAKFLSTFRTFSFISKWDHFINFFFWNYNHKSLVFNILESHF